MSTWELLVEAFNNGDFAQAAKLLEQPTADMHSDPVPTRTIVPVVSYVPSFMRNKQPKEQEAGGLSPQSTSTSLSGSPTSPSLFSQEINRTNAFPHGRSFLHLAAASLSIDLVEKVLFLVPPHRTVDNGCAELSNEDATTGYSVSGTSSTLPPCVRRANVNVDSKDSDGNTPLHMAILALSSKPTSNIGNAACGVCQQGIALVTPPSFSSREIVRLLLCYGANPAIVNNRRQSPLHVACASGGVNSFGNGDGALSPQDSPNYLKTIQALVFGWNVRVLSEGVSWDDGTCRLEVPSLAKVALCSSDANGQTPLHVALLAVASHNASFAISDKATDEPLVEVTQNEKISLDILKFVAGLFPGRLRYVREPADAKYLRSVEFPPSARPPAAAVPPSIGSPAIGPAGEAPAAGPQIPSTHPYSNVIVRDVPLLSLTVELCSPAALAAIWSTYTQAFQQHPKNIAAAFKDLLRMAVSAAVGRSAFCEELAVATSQPLSPQDFLARFRATNSYRMVEALLAIAEQDGMSVDVGETVPQQSNLTPTDTVSADANDIPLMNAICKAAAVAEMWPYVSALPMTSTGGGGQSFGYASILELHGRVGRARYLRTQRLIAYIGLQCAAVAELILEWDSIHQLGEKKSHPQQIVGMDSDDLSPQGSNLDEVVPAVAATQSTFQNFVPFRLRTALQPPQEGELTVPPKANPLYELVEFGAAIYQKRIDYLFGIRNDVVPTYFPIPGGPVVRGGSNSFDCGRERLASNVRGHILRFVTKSNIDGWANGATSTNQRVVGILSSAVQFDWEELQQRLRYKELVAASRPPSSTENVADESSGTNDEEEFEETEDGFTTLLHFIVDAVLKCPRPLCTDDSCSLDVAVDRLLFQEIAFSPPQKGSMPGAEVTGSSSPHTRQFYSVSGYDSPCVAVMRMLINRGANLAIREDKNRFGTALHAACRLVYPEGLRLLLSSGADCDAACDPFGYTAQDIVFGKKAKAASAAQTYSNDLPLTMPIIKAALSRRVGVPSLPSTAPPLNISLMAAWHATEAPLTYSQWMQDVLEASIEAYLDRNADAKGDVEAGNQAEEAEEAEEGMEESRSYSSPDFEDFEDDFY